MLFLFLISWTLRNFWCMSVIYCYLVGLFGHLLDIYWTLLESYSDRHLDIYLDIYLDSYLDIYLGLFRYLLDIVYSFLWAMVLTCVGVRHVWSLILERALLVNFQSASIDVVILVSARSRYLKWKNYLKWFWEDTRRTQLYSVIM